MKKLLLILFAAFTAATIFAAEPVTEQTTTDVSTISYLWRDGKDFYLGKTLLTKQACENLLKNTCPEAFRQYDKGQKMIKAGWSLLGIGIFMWATSPCMYFMFDDLYDDNVGVIMQETWGFVGFVATISSVPIACVGYATRKKTPDIYNYRCMQREPDITYNITANPNGLGFAINF